MSLRTKILYILLAITSFSFVGQTLIMGIIVFPDFVHLEDQRGELDMLRIHESVTTEANNLDTLCSDWASWDSAVAFVEGRMDEFVEMNIPEAFFENGSVDYLHIVDIKGETKYRRAFAPLTGEDFTIGVESSLYFNAKSSGELPYLVTKGLVFVDGIDSPLMLVLRPIIKSNGRGPIAGSMVMGRFLDMELLQQRVGVDFAFIPLATIPDEGDTRQALDLLQAGGETPLLEYRDEQLYIYSLQQSIQGEPLSLVAAHKPAEIWRKGYAATRATMLCYLAGSVLILAAIYLLLSRIVTNPIDLLGKQTREIIRSGDFSGTITTHGQGEIAELAQDINGLLGRIVEHEKEISAVNTKLLQQSLTDPLTGLSNRRDFDVYLEKEWERLQRSRLPLAVVMCDVDYFKKYNDAYGHLKGDRCLQLLAMVLGDIVKRPADFPARYGGEEFVVVLPETDLAGAVNVGQGICDAVRGMKIEHVVSDVSPWVTVSVGVASLVPNDTMNSGHLIKMADEALYKAKDQGRNQVVEFVAKR